MSGKTLGEGSLGLPSLLSQQFRAIPPPPATCQTHAARPAAHGIDACFHLYQCMSVYFISCTSDRRLGLSGRSPPFSFFFFHGTDSIITCCVPLGDTQFPGAAGPPCLNATRDPTLSLLLRVLRCFSASVLQCFNASPTTLRLHPSCPPCLLPRPARNTALPCSTRARFSRLQPHDFGRACRNTARLGVGNGGVRELTLVSSIA